MADRFSTGHRVQKRNPTDKFHIFRTLCFDVFSLFYILSSFSFFFLLSLLEKKKACGCLYFALVCERIIIAELGPDVLLVGAC